jgi:lipopolysaccharide/colanic/teichoic acid biosynthesis glycosyltransferase
MNMKRIFDIVVACMVLSLLWPLMFLTALLVRLKLGKPVIFRQLRPGLHGRPFPLLKFRTMVDARDHAGRLLPDAQRLTRFGSVLRRSSLDELPSLLNVIKGELSLVGPRPLLVEYLPLYSAMQVRRHEVRPGITGWAQVNGRNALSWEEKFELDVWYVEHQSMSLDLKILCLTVKKVLKADGVSANGEATMPRFKGSSE